MKAATVFKKKMPSLNTQHFQDYGFSAIRHVIVCVKTMVTLGIMDWGVALVSIRNNHFSAVQIEFLKTLA